MRTFKLYGILTVKNVWIIPVFCVTGHVHCIVTRGVTWTCTLQGARQMNYAELQALFSLLYAFIHPQCFRSAMSVARRLGNCHQMNV